jgi:hypothetical protein
MIRTPSMWIVLTLSMGILLAMTACVSSRYVANPSTTPPEVILQGVTEDLAITLRNVIVPDGVGSWVKGAKWTEWVLTFNTSADVRVERIALIDARGVYVNSNVTSLQDLESTTERMAQDWKTGTVNLAAGALQFVPIPFLTYGVYLGNMMYSSYARTADYDAIQQEFRKRTLPLPLDLGRGADVTGSAFFPLLPQPRTLAIKYHTSKGETELKLPLDQLGTLAPETPKKQ